MLEFNKPNILIKRYVSHISNSLERTKSYQSKLDQDTASIVGMSGILTRHFLNNLLSMTEARYLEVGVWLGSTFCAALIGNVQTIEFAIGIDNWSEFNKDGFIKNSFIKNVYNVVNKSGGKAINNICFIEENCFQTKEVLSKLLAQTKTKNFNVYFYDGGHSRIEHEQALTYYIDFMSDVFIYICDDWNWTESVEYGTRDAYKKLGLTVCAEWAVKTIVDNDKDWWNGYYIAVVGKKKEVVDA